MSEIQKYDIIIVGAGAAGLSLASSIAQTEMLSHLQVLLLDKSEKKGNDRTWCFWESGDGDYDDILTRSWPSVYFHSNSLSTKLDIDPYVYKMLRSSDFYNKTLSLITRSENVTLVYDEVKSIDADTGKVDCANGSYISDMVFSSKLPIDIDYSKSLYTDQHFGGWFVEFQEDVFDSDTATFMDFRIDQNNEHRFCYVLPLTGRKALVEVAIFSNDHQDQNGYDQILADYISEYISESDYSIKEREYGVIPMTNYSFWDHNKGKLYHIGTAGGAVKPSSGYAFRRILQHTDRIIECLVSKGSISKSYDQFRGRHLLYDSTMLDVLEVQNISGAKVFSDLFKNAKPDLILKFLDGDTTFIEDIGIMKSVPIWPFIKGMSRVMLK